MRIIQSFVLRFLYRFIPKDKNLWVFGAWSGTSYSDNPKYLFEYLNNQKSSGEKTRYVWLSGNDAIVKHVRSLGYEAFNVHSIAGFLVMCRAGVAFETEGDWDISLYFRYYRCVVIQLWHGIGAKQMKWNDNIVKKEHRRMSSYYWMATSDLYVKEFTKIFGITSEKFTITGYPRNDSFVNLPVNKEVEAIKSLYPECKFVIYMPTHRNFGRDGNEHINLESLTEVDEMFRQRNVIMVYKPHAHELSRFLDYESRFTNIILAKDSATWGDPYSYLHYFDLLISDYSSVTTDFLCSGKPVVLFTYDIDKYNKEDSGLEDYFWDSSGGPMCMTWQETIDQVMSLLSDDTWREERERCRKLYHQFNDGKNCERVYHAVKEILGNMNN